MHNGAYVIALVGILNHADKFDPLGYDIDRVIAYDPRNEFVADKYITQATNLLYEQALEGPVILAGSSLGGMLIPFVVDLWRQRDLGLHLDRLKVVIEDAPSGVESMMAAFCSPMLGKLITSPFGNVLRPLSQIKIGPKDEYIEIPSPDIQYQLAGRAMSADDWRAWVKAESIKGLTGFTGDAWLSQLRWMITVGRDGSLAEAIQALNGIDVTYIACLGAGNDVVKQPYALDWWVRHVPGLQILRIEATHCGHLQQVLTFGQVFAQAMG